MQPAQVASSRAGTRLAGRQNSPDPRTVRMSIERLHIAKRLAVSNLELEVFFFYKL